MRERHGRVLAELAETGMAMVRRLSEALLATGDPQTLAQLGLAYHRVSRAVRLAIALEMRLSRAARESRAAPAPPATEARPPAERGDWYEYERDEGDEPLEDLDVLLDAEDLDADAVHDAVEACIANIRRDLDVGPELAGLPDLGGARPAVNKAPAPLRSGPPGVDPPPGGRRSRLMGGAAFELPRAGPARASPLAWPSSA